MKKRPAAVYSFCSRSLFHISLDIGYIGWKAAHLHIPIFIPFQENLVSVIKNTGGFFLTTR